MNKKIGIVGSSMGENAFGVGKNYLEMISRFGDPIIIMPNDKLIKCDLLIMQGGMDISPSSYGATPGFHTSNSDVFKQNFYDKMFKYYVEAGVPIFGICLGMQQINTFFGGTLFQNAIYHDQSNSRWAKGHKVIVCDENARINKQSEKFEVNSHHHQLVTLNSLSKELIPLCLAEELEQGEAVVEALKHKNLPIAAIQWHFEEWYDEYTFKLINNLLEHKVNVLA